MDSTTSISKGCFAFVPNSTKGKKKKRNSEKDEFDEFYTFHNVSVYSSIIDGIEQRIKEINNDASHSVLQELVQFVSKCSKSDFAIPTAVLLTGVNLPDHQVLFQGLADILRQEVTRHVSILLSSECSTVKNTIEQLTSQFLKQTTLSLDPELEFDGSDSEEESFDDLKRSQCTMPGLVQWYKEQKAHFLSPKKCKTGSSPDKLVVIIPDFEGFSTKVLQDVVLILSGYLDRLPLVLVFGVATSVKALQSSLPHRITSRMHVQMFQSRPSVHFLNNTVNEIFLSCKNSCPFLLGPKLFKFLTDVFIFYDFSVHGFVQGVKYCVMEHFYNNPLSRICCPKEKLAEVVEELTKEEFEQFAEKSTNFRTYIEKLPKEKMKTIFQSEKAFKSVILKLMKSLHTQKDNFLLAVWLLHTLVHDLPEAPLGKQVREVYTEVMSGPIVEHPKYIRSFDLLNLMSKQELLQKIDEMNVILTEAQCLKEEQAELMELREVLADAGQNVKSPLSSPTKKRPVELAKGRKQFFENLKPKKTSRIENEFEQARTKLLTYLKKSIFQSYLVSLSTLPLHEVLLIDNMSAKRHIVGAPRAALHIALNNPHHYLQCDCCKTSESGEILLSMPDVCIAYKLHLESGALINMYDWLQSFVTVVSPEDTDRDERKVSPALQARFTRAVSELQFLGFVKASKKKTDHVARLTWGGTC